MKSVDKIEYTDYEAYLVNDAKTNSTRKPMTNTQHRFAKKIFENQELVDMLMQPGDKLTIFKDIIKFLKK